MRNVKIRVMQTVLSMLVFAAPIAFGQQVAGCGSLQNAFGPFDYRDPSARGQPLQLVESAHFTPDVEALRKGNIQRLGH